MMPEPTQNKDDSAIKEVKKLHRESERGEKKPPSCDKERVELVIENEDHSQEDEDDRQYRNFENGHGKQQKA